MMAPSVFFFFISFHLFIFFVVFAIHWHGSAMDLHVFPTLNPFPPLSPSHPSGSSQCISPEHLSHASSLGWWSVSHLIVYLFQCFSLRTSHPRLLPQSPKVCSVHLCLLFCFAYRIIVTIFFSPFIFISLRLITLQYCSGFCHTLTWISHGFTCVPHPDPPPTSFPTPSLWVFPVHQAWALVSCIQPGLVDGFTLDNIHVSMLFFQNIPPWPSPTKSKSLFCTSVSLFLFCI